MNALTTDQRHYLAQALEVAPTSAYAIGDTVWAASDRFPLQGCILAKMLIYELGGWHYKLSGAGDTWFADDLLFDSKDALINYLSQP